MAELDEDEVAYLEDIVDGIGSFAHLVDLQDPERPEWERPAAIVLGFLRRRWVEVYDRQQHLDTHEDRVALGAAIRAFRETGSDDLLNRLPSHARLLSSTEAEAALQDAETWRTERPVNTTYEIRATKAGHAALASARRG